MKLYKNLGVICAVIHLMISPAHAQTPDLDPEVQTMFSDIADVSEELIEELEASSDLSAIAVAQLDADADQILSFVGAEVAYLPYRGVLRGVDGVLTSRFGNSYDQAVALAALLQRAGFDAQALVGPAPEVSATPARTRRAEPFTNADDLEEIYEELDEMGRDLADALGRDLPEPPAQLAKPDLTTAIAGLKAAQHLMPQLATVEDIKSEGDLYGIVRYRARVDADWSWFDPARNTALPPQSAAKLRVLDGKIPQEHAHKVRIDLIAIRADGAETRVAQINGPAANLAQKPISFAISPSAQIQDEVELATYDPSQGLVVTSDLFETMAVSLDGTVVPMDALAGGAGDVFQTGAGLLGQAISSLGSDGEKKQAGLMSRMVLRTEITAPGISAIRAERVLYDATLAGETLFNIEEAHGLTNEERDTVLRGHMLEQISGAYVIFAGGYVDGSGKVALEIARMLNAISLEAAGDAPTPRDVTAASGGLLSSVIWQQMAMVFEETDTATHALPSLGWMRSFGRSGNDSDSGALGYATDILYDGRNVAAGDAVDIAALAVDAASKEMLITMALESQSEQMMPSAGAFERFDTLVKDGVAPMLAQDYLQRFTPDTMDAAQAIHIAAIKSAMDQGQTVIVWPAEDFMHAIWLELDPNKRTARLAGGFGEGNELTEMSILMLQINFVLVKAILDLEQCAGKKGEDLDFCIACAAGKATIGITGALIGPLGGALVATGVIGTSDVIAGMACTTS